jgi:mRNA interferase RelE/StbE
MYKIILADRAVKDIERLDVATKKRIGEKLKLFSSDPLNYAKKLINPKIGSYRFRIGNYRVIFDIVDDSIVILRMGHRSSIYK